MNNPLQDNHLLFADGGVIGHNPSEIGGTMAWRRVEFGSVLKQGSAVITPSGARLPAITNNLTEMLALIMGFEELPEQWIGTICSDSQVTLGCMFMGWKWKGIPAWIHRRYQYERRRLKFFEQFKFVLLDGHPTKAQLQLGVGKRGHPVSELFGARKVTCSNVMWGCLVKTQSARTWQVMESAKNQTLITMVSSTRTIYETDVVSGPDILAHLVRLAFGIRKGKSNVEIDAKTNG